MADAAAAAAPTAGAVDTSPTEGTPTQPGADGHAQAQAAAARKFRLKGIDGDEEREYEESHIVSLAQRGKRSAQILSKAEQRAQEALKREADVEGKLARLKDPKSLRATLKELGVDVRALSEEELLEAIEEQKLTPEQRRIRDLERTMQEKEEAEANSKKQAEEKALEQETQRHVEQLSAIFLEVMTKAGLPKTSSRQAFPRIAALYQAAEAAGVELTPEVVAERVKSSLRDEHKALIGSMSMDELAEWFGAEKMKAIRQHAVEQYKRNKAAPTQAPAMSAQPQRQTPRERQTNSGPTKGSSEWWRQKMGQ